jgi:hypothetical protein
VPFPAEVSRPKCSLTGRAQPARIQALRDTGATGLEPATSGVTGRRSNQLSYAPEGIGWTGGAARGQIYRVSTLASSGRSSSGTASGASVAAISSRVSRSWAIVSRP